MTVEELREEIELELELIGIAVIVSGVSQLRVPTGLGSNA